MLLDDTFILALLWFLPIIGYWGIGPLFFTKQSYHKIADAIERGGIFYKYLLPYYRKIPFELPKIFSFCLLLAVLAFYFMLLTSKTLLTQSKSLILALLIISLVIQVILILVVFWFRAKHKLDAAYSGYNKALDSELALRPPSLYFVLLLIIVLATFIAQIVKVCIY